MTSTLTTNLGGCTCHPGVALIPLELDPAYEARIAAERAARDAHRLAPGCGIARPGPGNVKINGQIFRLLWPRHNPAPLPINGAAYRRRVCNRRKR